MSVNVIILHWVVIVTLGNYSHFKSAEFMLVIGLWDDLQGAVFVLVILIILVIGNYMTLGNYSYIG